MDTYNSYITFIEYQWDGYESKPVLVAKRFRDLSDQERFEIFQQLWCDLTNEKIPQNVKTVLNNTGFFSKEEIKAEKGITIANKDVLYYLNQYSQLRDFKVGEGIDEFWLKEMGLETQIFQKVTMPENVAKKILELKQKNADAAKKREAKKKESKIKKAEKLLREAGKL